MLSLSVHRKGIHFTGLRFLLLSHLFVENVLPKSFANAFQLGNIPGEFFDTLHLFIQEMRLQKVTQVDIILASSNCVQVQKSLHVWSSTFSLDKFKSFLCFFFSTMQCTVLWGIYLVHSFLQLKGCSHSIQRTSPFVSHGLWNSLKHDASSTTVLIGHEFLGMLTFFIWRFFEKFVKPRKV